MCGIAGVLAWHERYRVSTETLARMCARIAHRGPDGHGTYINHDGSTSPEQPQLAFGHARLAILDPDPRSDQPFTDGQGRWITFNGEIYNFRELRAELTKLRPDYPWRTTGDTEVLLLAYATWGRKCLEKLNGMFAFAIWDDGELFLARDRMGQKPLYYAHRPDGAFAFASELAALRALPWLDTTLDARALTDYLTWGYIPRGTIYRGASTLPPATWLGVSPQQVDSHAYFNPNDPAPASGESLSEEKTVQRTRQLVLQAVRRQLVSDVPLGCFLSGGIDSSIVAAAMCQAVGAGQRILTFSIGFDDPRYDETPYAREVADHLDTEHRQFIVKPDAAADLPKLAEVFGEPFGDSSALPTHYLSRETRRHVKVALSGDGGDELFGGYDRYLAMSWGQRLRPLPRRLLAIAHSALGAGAHPKSRLSRVRRFLATLDLEPAARYASYLRLFDESAIHDLLKPEVSALAGDLSSHQRLLTDRFEELHGVTRDAVQTALAVDRELYLPEDLLTKVDRCSMLHALEVRSPFMDHELVHFASVLSTDQLLKGGGKRMLRQAFAADLPARVFSRPKMGFAIPIGDWLRGTLRPMLNDALTASTSFATEHFKLSAVRRLIDDHHHRRHDHSQRLHALLMLELWWRFGKS